MKTEGKAFYIPTEDACVLSWGEGAPDSTNTGIVPGGRYTDTTNAAAYINTNTAASPTWKAIDVANLILGDSETIVFGTGSDVTVQWTGAAFTVTAANVAGEPYTFTAGQGAATSAGGAFKLVGGAGGGTSGNGGLISATGGASTSGDGGAASVTGGAGGTAGDGGDASLVGGVGGATGSGGAIAVTGGDTVAGATGTGGAVAIAGGANANTTNGAGGAVSATGGAGKGTGDGGAASLVGGAGGATGAGGAIAITGGASAGVGGTAGAVTIDAGAVTGGTGAAVSIAPTNTNATGITLGNDTSLADNVAIIFGTGSDVDISWNASYLVGGSVGMWAAAPVPIHQSLLTATGLPAYELHDDFFQHDPTATVGRWPELVVGAGTQSLLDDVAGGVCRLSCQATTDDACEQMTFVSAPFYLAAGKTLWYETRIKITGDIQSEHSFGLVALGENLTAVADVLPADGVSFSTQDGSLAVALTCSKDGTDTGAVAGVHTLVSGSWVTLGFLVNGVTSVTPYVNGVAGTAATTTICDDESLAPYFLVRNGDGVTTQIMDIDYVKVVQLR
jgi:hypothetical protein